MSATSQQFGVSRNSDQRPRGFRARPGTLYTGRPKSPRCGALDGGTAPVGERPWAGSEVAVEEPYSGAGGPCHDLPRIVTN
eukprot:11850129-Alexandrium_andersonii.AAC.1